MKNWEMCRTETRSRWEKLTKARPDTVTERYNREEQQFGR